MTFSGPGPGVERRVWWAWEVERLSRVGRPLVTWGRVANPRLRETAADVLGYRVWTVVYYLYVGPFVLRRRRWVERGMTEHWPEEEA